MFLQPQHPISYFGMPSLSGETVEDVMMTVVCGNCEESVPIPSGLVKKHMNRVKSQKLRLGIDNYSFRTRKIMLDDKLELQRLDLEFMLEALKETRDPDTYADLSKQYKKGQIRYLSLLQEAVYMQKLMSEMIEDSTIDCSDIVRTQIKTCDAYDEDLTDIRKTLDYLRKENENFKKIRIAAANLAKKLASRFSEADDDSNPDRSSRSQPIKDQYTRSDRSSITEESALPERSVRIGQATAAETSTGPTRSSSTTGVPIVSKFSVPNRASRLNRLSNVSFSANAENGLNSVSSESFSPSMKHSSSPAARSLRTRKITIANRMRNNNHVSNSNESQCRGRSSVVQELPVGLDIEDSELLFEP